MDWNLAVEKNRNALAQIVAALFVVARCAPGQLPGRKSEIQLGRKTCNHLACVLRKAEAALRRLLVLFIRIHQPSITAGKSPEEPLPDFSTFQISDETEKLRFNFIDPRKPIQLYFDDVVHDAEFGNAAHTEQTPQTNQSAAQLLRRLAALDHVLKTLPAQAKRLARIIERRKNAPPGPGRVGPIRPGKPPGHCDRPSHEVDHVLRECHGLVKDHIATPP